jgi:hypothetical protein
MTQKYRKEHDLMGYEAEDLIDDFDHIKLDDVLPYVYPDNRELEQVGVRGLYLNNYIRWDSRIQHEQMIKNYAYETAKLERTFDTYNDIDCWVYADVHDFIKFVKHGYGVASDHTCREIRFGRLGRDEGLRLVKPYIYRNPKHLELFLSWIGITKNAFFYLVDQHRNQLIWSRDENWHWALTAGQSSSNSICVGTRTLPNEDRRFRNFISTPGRSSSDSDDHYILIGRGI